MIRVLLVDDSAAFRAGMTRLLATIPEIELCGTAADGASGVDAALQLQPDIVLMDISMPQTSGIEATRRLHDQAPHIGLVALTMLEDDDAVGQALRAGARGYLTKDAGAEEIRAAVRAVARGEAALDPAVQRHVVAALGGGDAGSPAAAHQPELPDGLTPREAEVLALIAAGLTNAEIADRLVVSAATVKSHVNHIFAKAGVRDRAQAVVYAYSHGLAQASEPS